MNLEYDPVAIPKITSVLEEYFLDNSESIISELVAKRKLCDFIQLMGANKLVQDIVSSMAAPKKKTIVVVGQSSGLSKRDFEQTLHDMGGDEIYDLELYLEYDKIPKIKFDKFKDRRYRAIMFGPLPHSGISKGDYASVVDRVEHEVGFPEVIELGANSLKLTKESFMRGIGQIYISDSTNQ